MWEQVRKINATITKRKGTWLRFNSMGVKNIGTTKEIVLRLRRKISKEEEKNTISLKKWRTMKRISLRKRK